MSSEDKSSQVESFDEKNLEVVTLPADQATGERRRPGRIEHPSRALIPLLRHPTVGFDTDADNEGQQPSDEHRAPRGIVFGVLLSLPIWVLIIVGVLWAVR